MAMYKDYCSINFAGLTHDHSLVGPNDKAGVLLAHRLDETHDGESHDDDDSVEDSLCSAIAILKRHPMYDCLVLVKKYRNCLAGYSLEFPIDLVREAERVPTNESARHHSHLENSETQRDGAQEIEGGAGRRSLQQRRSSHHKADSNSTNSTHNSNKRSKCARRRLVTRFLDGDDPMHRDAFLALRNSSSISLAGSEYSVASSSGPTQTTTNSVQEEASSTADQVARATTTTTAPGSKTEESSPSAGQQQLMHPDDLQPFVSQLDDLGQQCSLVHVPINGLLDRLECYTRSGVAVDGRVYAFAMGLKTAERMMTTKSMKELQETPI